MNGPRNGQYFFLSLSFSLFGLDNFYPRDAHFSDHGWSVTNVSRKTVSLPDLCDFKLVLMRQMCKITRWNSVDDWHGMGWVADAVRYSLLPCPIHVTNCKSPMSKPTDTQPVISCCPALLLSLSLLIRTASGLSPAQNDQDLVLG